MHYFFLCFSGNQIGSLPDDLFTHMPDLRGVDFSNTNVITLPESVFGRIMPQLGLLYLEGKIRRYKVLYLIVLNSKLYEIVHNH